MRYRKHSPTFRSPLQRLLNIIFALGIERTRRLVQYKNFRILKSNKEENDTKKIPGAPIAVLWVN